MMGFTKFCTLILGMQLTTEQRQLTDRLGRGVLTGRLRAFIHEAAAEKLHPRLSTAMMLWTSKYGWRRLPVLLVSTSALRDEIRDELIVFGSQDGLAVDPVEAHQVRAVADGFDGLARKLPDGRVVGPDFLVFDGFVAADQDLLHSLPRRLWPVMGGSAGAAMSGSGVLLGSPVLVTGLGGQGTWILG